MEKFYYNDLVIQNSKDGTIVTNVYVQNNILNVNYQKISELSTCLIMLLKTPTPTITTYEQRITLDVILFRDYITNRITLIGIINDKNKQFEFSDCDYFYQLDTNAQEKSCTLKITQRTYNMPDWLT